MTFFWAIKTDQKKPFFILSDVCRSEGIESIEMTLTDGLRHWQRKLAQTDVQEMATACGLNLVDFSASMLAAVCGLIGSEDSQYTYSISDEQDHCSFTWAKVLSESASYRLAAVRLTVQTGAAHAAAAVKILNFCFQRFLRFNHELEELKHKIQGMSDERERLLTDYQEAVNGKISSEKQMLTKFANLLNEKKARIATLENEVEQLRSTREIVSDSEKSPDGFAKFSPHKEDANSKWNSQVENRFDGDRTIAHSYHTSAVHLARAMESDKENAIALVEAKRLTLTIVNFMGSSMQVLALPTATLGNLKDIVEDAWNVPTEDQLLYHGNKLLSDDKLKLVDIGLKDGDSLKLRTKLNFLQKAKPQTISRFRDAANAKKQLNVVIKLTKENPPAKGKNTDMSGTSEDDRRDGEKSKKVQPALASPPGKPLMSRGERLGRELDARLANAKTKRRIYRFRQQLRLSRQASILRRSKQCSFGPSTSTSSFTKPKKKCRRKFGRKHVFAEFVPKRDFGRRAHSQVRIRCDCPTALSRKFRTQLRKHKDADLQAFVEENREAWLRMRKERQSPETASEPTAGSKPKKQRRRHCDFHTCPQRMMIFRKRSVQPRACKGSGAMGGTLGFLKYVGLDWIKWQDERKKAQGQKGSPKSPKLNSDDSSRKSNSSQVQKKVPRRRRNDKDKRTEKL